MILAIELETTDTRQSGTDQTFEHFPWPFFMVDMNSVMPELESIIVFQYGLWTTKLSPLLGLNIGKARLTWEKKNFTAWCFCLNACSQA